MRPEFMTVLLFAAVHAFDFNCDPRSSCTKNAGMDFQSRSCECDPSCSTYGDCCSDAPSYGDATGNYNCVPYGSANQAAYVTDACPVQNGNDLQKKCLEYETLPVTDPKSNTTYKNHFCADCNDIVATNLVSWIQICYHTQKDVVVSVNDDKNHGQNVSNFVQNIVQNYVRCSLTVPETLIDNIRHCRPKLVSVCPESWADPETKRRCQHSPMGVVYSASGTAYRNSFCAECNGLVEKDLKCEKFGAVLFRKRRRMNFATLMDFYDKDGNNKVGFTNGEISMFEAFALLKSVLTIFVAVQFLN